MRLHFSFDGAAHAFSAKRLRPTPRMAITPLNHANNRGGVIVQPVESEKKNGIYITKIAKICPRTFKVEGFFTGISCIESLLYVQRVRSEKSRFSDIDSGFFNQFKALSYNTPHVTGLLKGCYKALTCYRNRECTHRPRCCNPGPASSGWRTRQTSDTCGRVSTGRHGAETKSDVFCIVQR
jgi:hypothetical protein